MNATTSKNLFRALGILAALMGMANFCVAPTFLMQKDWVIIIGFLFIFLGLYLIYVGYLVWWRFSPMAIRHICGVVAFYSLGIVQVVLEWLFGKQLSVLSGFISLFSIIGIFFLYRWASKYLARMMFGNETK